MEQIRSKRIMAAKLVLRDAQFNEDFYSANGPDDADYKKWHAVVVSVTSALHEIVYGDSAAAARQLIAREKRLGLYGRSFVPAGADDLSEGERVLMHVEFGPPRVDDRGNCAWWFDCTDA